MGENRVDDNTAENMRTAIATLAARVTQLEKTSSASGKFVYHDLILRRYIYFF